MHAKRFGLQVLDTNLVSGRGCITTSSLKGYVATLKHSALACVQPTWHVQMACCWQSIVALGSGAPLDSSSHAREPDLQPC